MATTVVQLATTRAAPNCVLLHFGWFSGGTVKVPGTADSLAVASLARVSSGKVSIARVSGAVVSVTCPFSRNKTVRRSKGQSEVRLRLRLRGPHWRLEKLQLSDGAETM